MTSKVGTMIRWLFLFAAMLCIAAAPSTQPTEKPAKSIVYVCDASAAVAEHFELVVGEVDKAIDMLLPIQGANVIFCANGTIHQALKEMRLASPARKKELREFIRSITPGGEADVLAGLRRALAHRPEVIYLLTASGFDDPAKAIEFVRENAGGTRINTIAFEREGEYEAALKSIAESTGGTFKRVRTADITK